MKNPLEKAFLAALKSCHPDSWMGSVLDIPSGVPRKAQPHIFACGKAAADMCRAALNACPDKFRGGLAIIPEGANVLDLPLPVFISSHPHPTSRSVEAARIMIQALTSLTPDDHFVFFLSGGTSALMELPVHPLSIDEVAASTRILMNQGLDIHQLNRFRTVLSQIKGGGLGARTTANGKILVMSDVPGDVLPAIGSGPFFRNPVSRISVHRELEQQNLLHLLPGTVRHVLKTASDEDRSQPAHTFHHEIVLDNAAFRGTLGRHLREMGIRVDAHSGDLAGEAREMGKTVAQFALDTVQQPGPPVEAFIWGGETTVTVRGNGRGGRNQEAALSALETLRGHPGISCLFAGTDGMDGSTAVAGALIEPASWDPGGSQLTEIRQALENNDSGPYFQRHGGQMVTGWTGINVMDIGMVLLDRSSPDLS